MEHDLQGRLKTFSLSIIQLYETLPKTSTAQILGKQVLRSGTSVGAQHREANRSRSKAEFISKMQSALQELDETDYWLDLLQSTDAQGHEVPAELIKETNELISIFVTIIKNAKA